MYSMIKLNRVGIHNVISSKENTSYGLKKKKKNWPNAFLISMYFCSRSRFKYCDVCDVVLFHYIQNQKLITRGTPGHLTSKNPSNPYPTLASLEKCAWALANILRNSMYCEFCERPALLITYEAKYTAPRPEKNLRSRVPPSGEKKPRLYRMNAMTGEQ